MSQFGNSSSIFGGDSSSSNSSLRDAPSSSAEMNSGISQSSIRHPPPVPMRDNSNTTYQSTSTPYFASPHGSQIPYSMWSGSGYGPYSVYGNSIGYPGAMNRYSSQNVSSDGPSFAQIAEDGTRSAFQSIESIVQAFGSVTMMLESTYYAVYNSFRAVVGVADHFIRLQNHFLTMLASIAIFRTLRRIYGKILILLGLRSTLPEDLLTEASSRLTNGPSASRARSATSEFDLEGQSSTYNTSSSVWPVILFFVVVFGGPILIWRLLRSMVARRKDISREWFNGMDEHFTAIAQYDFDSQQEDELSFRTGQQLFVAPKNLQPCSNRGWILGAIDEKHMGLVPANYVRIIGKRPGKRAENERRLKMISHLTTSTTASQKTTNPPLSSLNGKFDNDSNNKDMNGEKTHKDVHDKNTQSEVKMKLPSSSNAICTSTTHSEISNKNDGLLSINSASSPTSCDGDRISENSTIPSPSGSISLKEDSDIKVKTPPLTPNDSSTITSGFRGSNNRKKVKSGSNNLNDSSQPSKVLEAIEEEIVDSNNLSNDGNEIKFVSDSDAPCRSNAEDNDEIVDDINKPNVTSETSEVLNDILNKVSDQIDDSV